MKSYTALPEWKVVVTLLLLSIYGDRFESFILRWKLCISIRKAPTNLPLTHKERSNDPYEYPEITYSASYLSAPATWEMSESQGETERWRERESPSRQIKKKEKKKVRNGQRWMDFQHHIIKTYLLISIQTPHALTHCSPGTLSSPRRYLSHSLLLSHKAFSLKPCRCSFPPVVGPNTLSDFRKL